MSNKQTLVCACCYVANLHMYYVLSRTTQIQNNNFASKTCANKWQRMKSKSGRFQFMNIFLAKTKDLNEL